MSKKNKKYKKVQKPVSVKSPDTKLGTPLSSGVTGKASSSLIVFDKRAKLYILILLVVYFAVSLLKIHTSNIGNWDIFFGKPESESVIAGKPRFIRMDEWMVGTPGIFSQYKLGMPVENGALGAGKTPVITGLPVKDISTLLRPNLWSYFIFDEERAFAFSWNFNIFISIISIFLLLMLLTGNNFWISVLGSLFIFFSSGVQWWSYSIGYQMMYLNGMLISFIYILYNKKLLPLIISGVIFLFSVNNFLFMLYPAFQVPLIYLYLLIFIGFLWQRKNFDVIKEKLLMRVAVFSVVLIVLGFFLYHYYNLVKDTYTVMLHTVYPGKRFETEGALLKGKFFSEFLGMFMTDTNTPKVWGNICEESGFLMVFPVIFYSLIYIFYRSKKIDPLLLSLSVYVIIGIIYVLIGFPAFLSKISLLSTSPSYRALPILEAGNFVLLFCYLGNRQINQPLKKFSWIEFIILAVVIIAFVRIASMNVNKASGNFFTASQVNIATLLVSLVYLMIRYKSYRFTKPILYSALAIMNFSNLSVNPVTQGLSAFYDNPMVKASKEIHDKEPNARWAVFGNNQWQSARLAQVLKFNGINPLNGVKFVPPIKEMRVLDPTGKDDSAYNRYAWINMATYIDGKDSVVIRPLFNDGYAIYMDPCSPRLKTLKVKYLIFMYKPQDAEIRCLTKVGEVQDLFIYKRNDE